MKIEIWNLFLKSQINPHFLFNIINSIYFKLIKKSISKRFIRKTFQSSQIYPLWSRQRSCDDWTRNKFCKDILWATKIRLENFDNVNLLIDVNNSFKIKPLLLMPLIENAFKFYSPNKINSFIKILIKDLNLEKLSIEVSNSYLETNVSNLHNGVGLVN